MGTRRARGAVIAVLLLVLAPVTAGCTGDDDPSGGASRDPSSAVDETPRAELRIRAGKVSGDVRKGQRKRAVRQVGNLAERWVRRAYAGQYPRTDFSGAFSGFTRKAQRLARQRRGVMSNITRGKQLASVRVAARSRVVVDVVADRRRRAAAATARVRVWLAETTTEGKQRRAVISGRLLLTHGTQGWQVFGFDMQRGKR